MFTDPSLVVPSVVNASLRAVQDEVAEEFNGLVESGQNKMHRQGEEVKTGENYIFVTEQRNEETNNYSGCERYDDTCSSKKKKRKTYTRCMIFFFIDEKNGEKKRKKENF